MSKIDTSRLEQKSGTYCIARSSALRDTTLLAVAGEYRSQTSRRYITLAQRDLSHRFSGETPTLVTTKYDGEGVFLYYEAGDEPPIFTFNAPSGRVRVGLPCFTAIQERLQQAGVKKGLFAAELYLKGAKLPRRPSVSDVISVSFGSDADAIGQLSLAVFDIIMLDGHDWRRHEAEFEMVWARLEALFGNDESAPIHRVEGAILAERALASACAERVERGDEGVVIRRLTRKEIYKVKPSFSVDAVVIGYVEGEFEGNYGITSLLTGLTDPSFNSNGGQIREFARVGSGFSDEQRVLLLEQLSRDKLAAPIDKTDNDGRPIQFITPQHIIELEGESLESESFSGRENRTPIYHYGPEGYQFRRLHPLPRLTYATFARLRDDKTLSDGGARVTQLISEQAAEQQSGEGIDPPRQATVARREVYVKESKGKKALRKFLLVESSGENRFPYVILHTDISLGRKSPIDHTVKVANNRDHADALFDLLIKENVKKGWERVA